MALRKISRDGHSRRLESVTELAACLPRASQRGKRLGAVISSVSKIPDGLAGVRQIVGTLNTIKDHYGRLPAIRSIALRIIGRTRDGDQAAQISALARFVREKLVYTADPLNAEFIQTPDLILLQISREGRARGDCDDHCVLFASLAESIGIPCQIAGVRSVPGAALPDHVIVISELENGPLEFDLCAKGADQPYYAEKLLPG